MLESTFFLFSDILREQYQPWNGLDIQFRMAKQGMARTYWRERNINHLMLKTLGILKRGKIKLKYVYSSS